MYSFSNACRYLYDFFLIENVESNLPSRYLSSSLSLHQSRQSSTFHPGYITLVSMVNLSRELIGLGYLGVAARSAAREMTPDAGDWEDPVGAIGAVAHQMGRTGRRLGGVHVHMAARYQRDTGTEKLNGNEKRGEERVGGQKIIPCNHIRRCYNTHRVSGEEREISRWPRARAPESQALQLSRYCM